MKGHHTSAKANKPLQIVIVSAEQWIAWHHLRQPLLANFLKLMLGKHALQLAQAACVRHACLRAPCVAWPLLPPTFGLSSFILFLRFLLLTHFGETPVCEIIFALIFWHN